jgi:hypothetical protein
MTVTADAPCPIMLAEIKDDRWGKAMGGSLLQLMASTKPMGMLNRWLSTFTAEMPVDPAALSSWRAESRKMRVQASVQSEKPPLLSY